MPDTPLVAVGPTPGAPWVTQAIEAGGGRVAPLAQAEALVWLRAEAPMELGAALESCPGLRWVQLPWAGIEPYVAAGVLDARLLWTCGKGVYAEPVAEHALGLALAGLRRLPRFSAATSWGEQAGTSLYDAPVTILGGGGIAEALAGLLAPFRADVTVVRRDASRSMPGATTTVGPGDLGAALGSALVVVVALALTPESTGIIGATELRSMRPDAWLINVARGAHVVTDDLVVALREQWIGGAALDVTHPEPLPDGHPLWSAPNCIITPHTANTDAMAQRLLAARVTDNVARYAAGAPLVGLVDVDAGY